MATAIGAYATIALVKTRAGITDTTDDTLLTSIVEEVNQFIETFTGHVLAPITYTAALFDGWPWPMGAAVRGGKGLLLPHGIRTVTALDVASATGGTFVAATAGEWFYSPGPNEMAPASPARILMLSDRATTVSWFPPGYQNVKLTGTGGYAAIPDDVRGAALAIAVRAWHGRQSGHTDIVGNDQLTGNPVVSRWVSAEDKRTLERYQSALVY